MRTEKSTHNKIDKNEYGRINYTMTHLFLVNLMPFISCHFISFSLRLCLAIICNVLSNLPMCAVFFFAFVRLRSFLLAETSTPTRMADHIVDVHLQLEKEKTNKIALSLRSFNVFSFLSIQRLFFNIFLYSILSHSQKDRSQNNFLFYFIFFLSCRRQNDI